MFWETRHIVNIQNRYKIGNGIWVYHVYDKYFTFNGKWYSNPEYIYLYYSKSLEPSEGFDIAEENGR